MLLYTVKVVLLSYRFVVTQIQLRHRTEGASQLAGFVAAKSKANTRLRFELFGDGADYDFLPLAGESFGRLCKEAARFLPDRGEVAA